MKNNQIGKINKLLLILMGVVVLFAGLYAFKTRNTIYNKVSSIAAEVTETILSEPSYTGYGVQLMATKDLKQAKQLMNDFAKDGYSAFVIESQMRGRPIYKVRIGPYAHRPEAQSIKETLKRRYPSNRYVKSSLVIYKP